MKRFWIRALSIALFWYALPAAAQQVQYSEGERADARLSFFMDRKGNLYPPPSIVVDERAMLMRRSPEEFATLRALYRDKAATPDNREWAALLESAGVSPSGSFDQDWTLVQDAYRTDLAARINDAARSSDQLVLLIHGFNNDYRDAVEWYGIVEEDLTRFASAYGQNIQFVRMYWNGLEGSPFKIWTAAQANGPWVGLELRRLLNLLDADIPLRVFTHSSGAFVLTNAIGDGSSAYPDLGEPYPTRAAGGAGYDIPLHLQDVRIAMLVPAQPLSAFSNFIRSDGSIHGMVPDRVILGTSENDFATGKARLLTSCLLLGATCMTTQPRNACRRVWGDLGRKPMLVNFDQPKWKSHDHSVAAYMRDRQWAELARGLLADSPAASEGDALCDDPYPSEERDVN